MKNASFVIFFSVALMGCGGSDSGGRPLFQHVTSSSTITYNNDTVHDVQITGSGNTINLETDVGHFQLDGSNNLVNLSEGVSVESCDVTGSDNTAQREGNNSMNCSVVGSGNQGF